MSTAPHRRRVLILCTGNTCRSQMAEALWRALAGDRWDAFSCGTRPHGAVSPLAIWVMAERGIDIAPQSSKGPDVFAGQHFDLVITVCDNAAAECPHFPGAARYLHWPFDDPPRAPGGEAHQLAVCRRVRNEIEAAIRAYLAQDA